MHGLEVMAGLRFWKDGGVTVGAVRSGLDLSNVEAGARPQDDLFGHVNGRWLADYDIPADRATDGAFRSLFDRAEVQVRDLITGASGEGRAALADGSDEQRIGDLYASFLDEDAVERRGVQPCPTSWRHRRAADPGAGAVVGALHAPAWAAASVPTSTPTRRTPPATSCTSASPGSACPTSPTTATSSRRSLAAYLDHIAAMLALVYGVRRRPRRDRGSDRGVGDQARRRALGRGQTPRRRPHLQPAHVRRSAGGRSRLRLARVDERAG